MSLPYPAQYRHIFVTFQKEGIHLYPGADTDPKLATGGWDDVSYLGHPHHHTFGIKVVIEVFHNERDIRALDLSGVDIFLECTGQPYTRDYVSRALEAGAKRVLISGPAESADVTVVLGANEQMIAGHKIISNASCTTNALAPLLKTVDDLFGIIGGQMTTVHCYTGSQPTVDQPRDDFARSRAAALSMVPTSTSAHKLVGKVLPSLAGKIEARAIRGLPASVSGIDLTVSL